VGAAAAGPADPTAINPSIATRTTAIDDTRFGMPHDLPVSNRETPVDRRICITQATSPDPTSGFCSCIAEVVRSVHPEMMRAPSALRVPVPVRARPFVDRDAVLEESVRESEGQDLRAASFPRTWSIRKI
jgi:hypothetical protein